MGIGKQAIDYIKKAIIKLKSTSGFIGRGGLGEYKITEEDKKYVESKTDKFIKQGKDKETAIKLASAEWVIENEEMLKNYDNFKRKISYYKKYYEEQCYASDEEKQSKTETEKNIEKTNNNKMKDFLSMLKTIKINKLTNLLITIFFILANIYISIKIIKEIKPNAFLSYKEKRLACLKLGSDERASWCLRMLSAENKKK